MHIMHAVVVSMNKFAHTNFLAVLVGVLLLSQNGLLQARALSLGVGGNIGYFHTFNQAEGGTRSASDNFLMAIQANGFVMEPWLLKVDGNLVANLNKSGTAYANNESHVLSGGINLHLFSQSRFPNVVSYRRSTRASDIDVSLKRVQDEKSLGELVAVAMDDDYLATNVSVRQGLLLPSGNRFDLWYSNSVRGSGLFGMIEDENLGGKFKARWLGHNLYVDVINQTQSHSLSPKLSDNFTFSLMHNFFPSSDYYIKSLVSHYQVDNKTEESNGFFVANSNTALTQYHSMFYWRAPYKPYSVSGSMRFHRKERDTGFDNNETDQKNAFGSLTFDWELNRRVRMSMAGNVSVIDSDQDNSAGGTAQLLLSYRSGQNIFGWLDGLTHSWYMDGGIGNRVEAHYDDADIASTFNAGVGHHGNKQWLTGNRSSARLGFSQSVRAYTTPLNTLSEVNADVDSLDLTHTASLSHQAGIRKIRSYSQITFMDSRKLLEDFDIQVVNAQASGSYPLNRLSSAGLNAALQSTRRNTEQSQSEGFQTSITAQINYQHARLFGIYKLKLRGKYDVSANLTERFGNRYRNDAEMRLSYLLGKLSTAVVGRVIKNDSGSPALMGMVHLNRQF